MRLFSFGNPDKGIFKRVTIDVIYTNYKGLVRTLSLGVAIEDGFQWDAHQLNFSWGAWRLPRRVTPVEVPAEFILETEYDLAEWERWAAYDEQVPLPKNIRPNYAEVEADDYEPYECNYPADRV